MKRVAVDIGGTFTDLVWNDDQTGLVGRAKILATPDPTDGVVRALERAALDPREIGFFLYSTTLVTNLLIERTGGTVGFITTRGFSDVLDVQTGWRPNPYDLQYEKPEPLAPRYLRREIDERIDAQGNVLCTPSRKEIVSAVRELLDHGIDALAICLLNSYVNPCHEQLVARIVSSKWPALHVSVSSEIDPRIREYPRMSTTLANAYAMPVFVRHAERLHQAVPIAGGIKFMQSNGGIVGTEQATRAPIRLAYSGPVGGVQGTKLIGRLTGVNDLITMDMGGTSFDSCVIRAGAAEEKEELYLEWGIPIRTHALDIHSIGAGGGSIAQIDSGGALQVGPRSAGSIPGPACYGRGGTSPTVTDANLLLGLIDPDRFAGGDIPLDKVRAESALTAIAQHFGVSLVDAALGVFRMVNSNMAQAMREITVFNGVDPRELTLLAFGGCGPQHAVSVAREMGIRSVIIPLFPAVFSAFGLLSTDLLSGITRTVLWKIHEREAQQLEPIILELEDLAKASLAREQGLIGVSLRRTAYIRYVGQSFELPVEIPGAFDAGIVYEAYERAHERQYGVCLGEEAEIVDLKVEATGHVPSLQLPKWTKVGSSHPIGRKMSRTAFGKAPVFERDTLGAGTVIPGPALLEERDTTTYLPDRSTAEVDDYGNLRIELG